MKPSTLMIKLQRQRRPLLRKMRQRVSREAYSMDKMRASRQMSPVLSRLAGVATRAIDFRDDLACGRGSQFIVFELGAGKVGRHAFEACIITEDPAVHVLCVAEGVAGKPFDAEVWVGGAGEVDEV